MGNTSAEEALCMIKKGNFTRYITTPKNGIKLPRNQVTLTWKMGYIEFRREMMGVRSDIKSLFKVLESLHLTPQKRMEKLTDFGFLQRWVNGVKKELDFIDSWIKRL